MLAHAIKQVIHRRRRQLVLHIHIVGFRLEFGKPEAIESLRVLEHLLAFVDNAGCGCYMRSLRDVEAVVEREPIGTHDFSVKHN